MESYIENLLTSEFGAENIFSDVDRIVVNDENTEDDSLSLDMFDKVNLSDADIEGALDFLIRSKKAEIAKREAALSISQVDSVGITKIYTENMRNSEDRLESLFIEKQLENAINLSDDSDISMITNSDMDKFIYTLIGDVLKESNAERYNEYQFYREKGETDLREYIESDKALRQLRGRFLSAVPKINMNYLELKKLLKKNSEEVDIGNKYIDKLHDELDLLEASGPVAFPESIEISPTVDDINSSTYVCGNCGEAVEDSNFFTVNMIKSSYLPDALASEYSSGRVLSVSYRGHVCPKCKHKNILSKPACLAISDKVIEMMKGDSFVYNDKGYRRHNVDPLKNINVNEIVLAVSTIKLAFEEYKEKHRESAQDYYFPNIDMSSKEEMYEKSDCKKIIQDMDRSIESYISLIKDAASPVDEKKYELIIAYEKWLLARMGKAIDCDFSTVTSEYLNSLPQDIVLMVEDLYGSEQKELVTELYNNCMKRKDDYQYKDCYITEYFLSKLRKLMDIEFGPVAKADELFGYIRRANVFEKSKEYSEDVNLLYKLPFRDVKDYFELYSNALAYKIISGDLSSVVRFMPGFKDKLGLKRAVSISVGGSKVKLVNSVSAENLFAKEQYLQGNVLRIFATLMEFDSAEQVLNVIKIPDKMLKREPLRFDETFRERYMYGDLPEMYEDKDDARKCVIMSNSCSNAIEVLQNHTEDLDIAGIEPTDFVAIVVSEIIQLAPESVKKVMSEFLKGVPSDLL